MKLNNFAVDCSSVIFMQLFDSHKILKIQYKYCLDRIAASATSLRSYWNVRFRQNF
jgi:hypothetical protein